MSRIIRAEKLPKYIYQHLTLIGVQHSRLMEPSQSEKERQDKGQVAYHGWLSVFILLPNAALPLLGVPLPADRLELAGAHVLVIVQYPLCPDNQQC